MDTYQLSLPELRGAGKCGDGGAGRPERPAHRREFPGPSAEEVLQRHACAGAAHDILPLTTLIVR